VLVLRYVDLVLYSLYFLIDTDILQLHYPVEIKLSSFVHGQLGKLGCLNTYACTDAFAGLFNGPRTIPRDSYVVVFHGKVSITTGHEEEDADFRTVGYTWQGKEQVVDSFDFASVSLASHLVKDIILTKVILYVRKPPTL
jgi:hypothetical protein